MSAARFGAAGGRRQAQPHGPNGSASPHSLPHSINNPLKITTILASPEFKASACAAQAGCAANRLAQFMCLNPKMVRGGLCRASAVEASLAEKNPRVRG